MITPAPYHHLLQAWLLATLTLLAPTAIAVADGPPGTKQPVFESDVVPVLKTHCFECHGAKREGGLDLRRRFAMVAGGDTGPAIVPGKPDQSLVLELLADGQMPPEGQPRVPAEQIALLRRWIATGAAIANDQEKPLPKDSSETVDAEALAHWAFQPVQNPRPPQVANPSWLRTPVDAFTLSALEQRGWRPAGPANRRMLIRRVYFDLVGLPPDPDAVEAFVQDTSPDAYERVVDQLLASPHYGERWAQPWLDVVRYAESEGFEYDRHLPGAWRYRDYVIESLNHDKPFDQFVREQIAGDELESQNETLQAAAIFHRLGAVRRNAGNPDIALSRNEVLTERTNIIGDVFLGLTVGCARCHNHKLEPISQKDYYRLQAYLAATAEHNDSLVSQQRQQAWEVTTEALEEQIAALKRKLTKANGEGEKSAIEQELETLRSQLPAPLPTIPTIRNDWHHRTPIHLLRRGEWEQNGLLVGPRPLRVLVSPSVEELASDVRHPRTHLARWLTDREHPLTARVMVNRLWQQHFGVGLVKTANDFGLHGDRPSHPELLDWLATQLMENSWRLKPIHRLIVLSSTYRQSSEVSPSAASTNAKSDLQSMDPENRLLWHFSRRRLSAEELRDAMLAVAGKLNLQRGGPSVMVPVDQELVQLLYHPDQWRVAGDVDQHDRRSIYLMAKRNLRLPFLEVFDTPGLQTSCNSRRLSTHAPQALELLNGRFSNAMAKAFAERLRRESNHEPKLMIGRAFQLAAWTRTHSVERELSLSFLRESAARGVCLGDLQSQWVRLCPITGPIRHSFAERKRAETSSGRPSAGLADWPLLRSSINNLLRRIRRTRSRTRPLISHLRPRVSFFCSWQAGRVRWIRSTPSRC